MTVDEMYASLKSRLADVVPDVELRYKAELAVEINRLKQEKNAVILGHNYMEPVLYHSRDRYQGRLAGTQPQGCPNRQRHHRLLRGQIHGRNGQDPEPDQDRAAARRTRAARWQPASPPRMCARSSSASPACRW